MRSPDLSRRLLILLCAAAMPVVGTAQDSDTGDGDDTDDSDPPPTFEECVAWSPEVQGACPPGDELIARTCGRVPQDPDAPGIYADGQCCYVLVDLECPSGSIGCGCSHGRPLLVAGRMEKAPPALTRAWFDDRLPAPDLAGLDRHDRARLAHFWASVAASEHASIASFHRLALELLALAAPSELVEAAQRAAIDEVRHARRAFTLASRFAGAAIGPAGLSLGGSLPLAADRIALAVATVREACVEETLSVVAAGEMLAAARDPAVRAVLEGIVRDEMRHAEIAWRLVRWVIDAEGPPAREAVRRAFAEASTPGTSDPHPPRAALAAWGCVGDDRLREAVTRARREVVDEAAARLLAC